MFGWFKSVDRLVYIRFRKEKVYLSHYPEGETFEELPIIAVIRKGDRFRVEGVGKAVLDLPQENRSIVYTPFEPFVLEPENFELAELTLRHLLQQDKRYKNSWIKARFVIHPDKSYISEQEEDAYRELGLSVGAREVAVYVGNSLDASALKALFER